MRECKSEVFEASEVAAACCKVTLLAKPRLRWWADMQGSKSREQCGTQ